MENDFYRKFGQLLRQARKHAGLSQADLATAIGLTRTSISNIEKGRQKVLLHTFDQLLHILKVQSAELLPASAHNPSKRSMRLDNLRRDERGLKFFERVMGEIPKEEHANPAEKNSQDRQDPSREV